MKIEIWSDIACPFCYIGKRKIEKALAKFPLRDKIEVEWKSFLLNPDQKTDPSLNTLEYLSQAKGWTMEQTREITGNVVAMAKAEGLDYQMDKTVVANSKNAHRLIHLAKEVGKADEMKERLLKAYFVDGMNIDDGVTLMALGEEVGLDREKIKNLLESSQFESAVDQDIYESRLIGVKGVPFFVFDRKFGISGAQADAVFDQTLEKAWTEFSKQNATLEVGGDETDSSCGLDGSNC